MENPEFQLVIPPDDPRISSMANLVLRLSMIPERLALEERTMVNHRDGRPENVAEHSFMLAIIAPVVAELYYPDLDRNLVARYGNAHDITEAYVGDVSTYDYDKVDHEKKARLEAAALRQVAVDFAFAPDFVRIIKEYEEQEIREARFVRALDKVMPPVVHFADEGATLREHTTKEEFERNRSSRNAQLREEYPDFVEVIDLREELINLLAERFL